MIDTILIMDNKTETLSKSSSQQNDIFNYNLDHVYCSDNTNYRNVTVNNATSDLKSLRKENKQLQAMLLLHLDLIQEQSNQIIAKDKHLLQLREENEQLRTRCERGDRRTSKGNTGIAGKTSNSPTIDTYFTNNDGTRNTNQIKTLASRLSDIDKNNSTENDNNKLTSEKLTNSINFKEQTIFERNALNKNRSHDGSSVIGANNGKLISKIILQRKQSESGEKIFIRTKNVDVEKHRISNNDLKEKLSTNMVPIKIEKMDIDNNQYDTKNNCCDEIKIDEKSSTVSTKTITNMQPIKIENNNEQKRKIEYFKTKETRQVRVLLEKIPTSIINTVTAASNSISINANSLLSSAAVATVSTKPTIPTPIPSTTKLSMTTTENVNNSTASIQPFMRRHSTRQNYLSTTKEYMTREWQLDEIQSEVNQLITDEPLKGASECLEIPKWKSWEFSGTREPPPEYEDLSDDAFRRRHERFLLDERKRKKWDVQRIREQRTIERLKRRHCKDEITQQIPENEFFSFYPSAENLKVIHLTNEYPVSAFGEVIPALSSSEFSLPWLRSSSSTFNDINNSVATSSSSASLLRTNSIADNPNSVSSIVFLSKRRAWRSKLSSSSSLGWKNLT